MASEPRRVVVFGGQGMLGRTVCRYFALRGYEIFALGRSEFDVAHASPESLYQMVRAGDRVVNCTGILHSRIGEIAVEELFRVNGVFPVNLARVCREIGAHCYHLGSDGVFSGERGGYTEGDLCSPPSLYGLSKLAGDAAPCMVLRASIVGEEGGKGRSLLEWVRSKQGGEINGYTNHRWNGITALKFAEVIEEIEQSEKYQYSLFHLYSPKVVTKYELIKSVIGSYHLSITLRESESADPRDTTLSSRYPLASELISEPIAEQLITQREFWSVR